MPADFLTRIVAYKKSLLSDKNVFFMELRKKFEKEDMTRYGLFKKAINKPGQLSLIAEIKKASPSKGIIREDFDVLKIAKIYADHGAAAFSILTEDKFFLGKPAYIKQVSEKFNTPILAKDFIIDEAQIYEAFMCGTSAVLLIVAILTDEKLKILMTAAHKLDLDCLVEVHDERELERALICGAEIIGINNRDLHTFQVDLNVSKRLSKLIPQGKVMVAESGIKTHDDIKIFRDLGFHAVLIGETFMKADNIGGKIDEVVYGRS